MTDPQAAAERATAIDRIAAAMAATARTSTWDHLAAVAVDMVLSDWETFTAVQAAVNLGAEHPTMPATDPGHRGPAAAFGVWRGRRAELGQPVPPPPPWHQVVAAGLAGRVDNLTGPTPTPPPAAPARRGLLARLFTRQQGRS